jgi:hypothetical protein
MGCSVRLLNLDTGLGWDIRLGYSETIRSLGNVVTYLGGLDGGKMTKRYIRLFIVLGSYNFQT